MPHYFFKSEALLAQKCELSIKMYKHGGVKVDLKGSSQDHEGSGKKPKCTEIVSLAKGPRTIGHRFKVFGKRTKGNMNKESFHPANSYEL